MVNMTTFALVTVKPDAKPALVMVVMFARSATLADMGIIVNTHAIINVEITYAIKQTDIAKMDALMGITWAPIEGLVISVRIPVQNAATQTIVLNVLYGGMVGDVPNSA